MPFFILCKFFSIARMCRQDNLSLRPDDTSLSPLPTGSMMSKRLQSRQEWAFAQEKEQCVTLNIAALGQRTGRTNFTHWPQIPHTQKCERYDGSTITRPAAAMIRSPGATSPGS
jgi:hypothetical protein